MKKLGLILLALTFVICLTAVSAQSAGWEGWGSASGDTWTKTQLNQGGYFFGSGPFGVSNFTQSSTQDGNAKLKGNGGFESNQPDDVKVGINSGYSTLYDQYQLTPGGYQGQTGTQYFDGKITIESPKSGGWHR